MPSRTWFITGTSRGFGREWALAALERGDRVVGTARNPSTLDDLAAQYPERFLALQLDVTDRGAAFDAVSAGARPLRRARHRRQQRRLRALRDDRGARERRRRAIRSRPTCSARSGLRRRRCRICASRAAATSCRSPRSAASPPSRRSASTTRRSGALEGFSQALAQEVKDVRHPRHADRAGRLLHRLGRGLRRGTRYRLPHTTRCARSGNGASPATPGRPGLARPRRC